MRVRAGYVSNSSSTSFLILTDEELKEESFLDLMGVTRESPLAGVFRSLYERIKSGAARRNVTHDNLAFIPEEWFGDDHIARAVKERLALARPGGLIAYYGRLDSDGDIVESFFCTESFEAANERMYFNCLECTW